MNRVLSFSNYSKLFEADENISSKAASQIVDLFFQAYGAIVTKIGDYKEAIDDLLAVAEEKDTTKKGQIMAQMIDKVAKKAGAEYKEAADSLLQVGKKIQEVYDDLISTDEGKASLEEINKAIYRQILAKQQGLTTASKEMKVEDKKTNESLEYDHIYEKNTFDDERTSLITKIKPLYADVVQQAKNATSEGIKTKSVEIAKKLKDMYDVLEDTPKFEGMKRKERISTIEKYNADYDALVVELNDARKKELLKLGIDKKITSSLEEIIKLINSATEKITAVDTKAAEDARKKEEENKKEEEDKKEEDSKTYEDIKSGTVDKENLKSKGKNVEQIKAFQEAFSSLYPAEKIKADGLYGKNTEKAVLKAATTIGGLIGEDLAKDTESGKKLTAKLQSAVESFIKNKDEIKNLIGANSSSQDNETEE